MPGLHRWTGTPTADEVAGDEETEVAERSGELTDEDLRASQPAPPAALEEWSVPATWDETTPYVSSIDGVVVDPAPSAPSAETHDATGDDDPAG